ncbi:MAG TPA: orotidine-5'-phosphate decarboxylase [Acidimicrobiales bacterium]|nr:orotidine-5'-phosphate decarboxylase [Acidimicrobiales bacterium]
MTGVERRDEAGASPATGVGADVRDRLAIALDLDDLVPAMRLARELRPWFGVAKVGLELYSAVGPDVINSLTDLGYEVFVDLKLHDIPTTVQRAARVVGALGASYLTLHAQGGDAMVRAGVEGFLAGASDAGLPEPTALAVTVLTSDLDAPPHVVPKRVRVAVEAGCGGIVCSARDLHDVKELAPRIRCVVPGIRPIGTPHHDQAGAVPPRVAIEAGADLLVIGRAVTQAADPAAAASAVAAELR